MNASPTVAQPATLPKLPDGTDSTEEQLIAREHYEKLRDKLVALQSAPVANAIAIQAVIQALTAAQLAYKATHGLIGNHPANDPTL